MLKKMAWSAAALLLLTEWGYAQVEIPPIIHEDLPNYYLDMVNVRSDKPNQSRLDVYIKVPYDELQFLKTPSDSFRAKYEVTVVIFDQDDFQADGKTWQRTVTVGSFAETSLRTRYSYSHISFDLDPGTYRVTVGLMDLDTRKTLTQKTKLELRDFDNDKLTISDVLFADSVHVTPDGAVKAFPHVNTPRRRAGSLYGLFYVYSKKDLGPYSVRLIIRNAKRKKVFQDTRKFPRVGMATPIVFAVPDSQLAHGQYAMQIEVKAKKHKAKLETRFLIHWQGMPVTTTDLEKAIQQLQYIARGKEMKKIKKARPEDQMRAFLDFWKRRDPTPGTERNELMEEYYRRVQYANEHFSGMREGWKTDMGMVYIMLGPPNDVERNPMTRSYMTSFFTERPIKAWEVWHYYDLNRYFIFVDENGFGDFRLENPQALDDLYNIFRY